MTIHTSPELTRKGRRLDRRNDNGERVLAVMRATGVTLRRTNRSTVAHWALSNGMPVTDTVARIVITHTSVVPAGDALFDFEVLSQTWHYKR